MLCTLSFTRKSVSDSVTSICIQFIWRDLRGHYRLPALVAVAFVFISAEWRVYCQISGLKTFMVKLLWVLAWTLSRSVVLWSAVSHYEDGRRGSTEGSADRDSLRSCTYCCRPASRVWALFVVKHSEDPHTPPPIQQPSLTMNTESLRGSVLQIFTKITKKTKTEHDTQKILGGCLISCELMSVRENGSREIPCSIDLPVTQPEVSCRF